MDKKVIEAFERIIDRFYEMEDFIGEMPFCPEWESDELESNDISLVSEFLEKGNKNE